MTENNYSEQHTETVGVNWSLVWRSILERKRLFVKPLCIAFVLSCVYIFSLPRYYTTQTSLAPEIGNAGAGGTLSSIASSFGFDLGEFQTSDAITPLLYPDLMEDNGFVTSLFAVKVVSQDGDLETTYHDYLAKHQKHAWWTYPVKWLMSLLPKKADEGGSKDGFDPYNLSRKETDVVEAIKHNVGISVDKKTAVISISVTDQDPYICRIVADSVKANLQSFIKIYRTNKARTDYEYYLQLTEDARKEYEDARQKYGRLSDANSKVALRSVQLEMEDMENIMQLKFNTYSTLNTQLQAAKAKVQERTPVFTMLQGAAVPVRPAGPKRMLFVFGMLLLTFLGTSAYILKDILRPQ